MGGGSAQYFLNILTMEKRYFIINPDNTEFEVSKIEFISYAVGRLEWVIFLAISFTYYVTNIHKIWLYFNS